ALSSRSLNLNQQHYLTALTCTSSKINTFFKPNITEASILIAPDWDLPFELMCDASDFAIAAVLGQRHGKHFRPIHYASFLNGNCGYMAPSPKGAASPYNQVGSSPEGNGTLPFTHAGGNPYRPRQGSNLRPCLGRIIFGTTPSCSKYVRIKSSGGVLTAWKPLKFLRLATMDPPGDTMAQTTPPKRCFVRNKMLKTFPLPLKKMPLSEYFPTASEEVFPLLSQRHAPAEEVCTAEKTPCPIKGVLRIQQYLQNEHYALWEVIEFGDSYQVPQEDVASESSVKEKGRTVAVTTEDIQKRRNDTFGGNEATKKTKKNQLKQQYGNFKAEGSETLKQTFNRLQAIVSHLEFMDVEIKQDDLNQKFLTSLAPEWLMYTIVWRNRSDLDTMSLDDLYNHLKVYEPEVQKKSESNSQNMAFISSAKNCSGKGEVNTASIPTAITHVSPASADVAAASISHDTDWIYMANEEENHALVADEEAPREFALMAKSSASSKNEVEARLVEFKNQEIKFCENIRGLEFNVESKNNRIERLTNELEELKKENEDDTITDYSRNSPSIESNSNDLQSSNSSVSENEESSSSILSKPVITFVKSADSPTVIKTNKDETVRKYSVKYAEMKWIKREFSNARTPQQNGVAERRNRTLIEAARTMVLVNKSQNKTLYELFNGRTLAIGFLKPFGCHFMILNTLDHLGKFEAKWDEGYFIGYSMSSKAWRVFNKRTKRVEENLHVQIILTFQGTNDAASQDVKKDVSSLRYISLPNWFHEAHLESSTSNAQDACNVDALESSGNSNLTATSTNPSANRMETLTVETPVPTVSLPVPTACLDDSPQLSSDSRLVSKRVTSQDDTPSLDNIITLTNRFEDILGVTINTDDSNAVEANLGNMEYNILASPTSTFRIHKDHPKRVRPIGTKWVHKNKKDERGIVIRNKARLVAQVHTQEEGVDYEEVFALVARIEAIRLFLAYASFMGFTVYQMDVKSAFLYGTIERKSIEFEALMHEKFQMSAMGELNFFLGLQVLQKKDDIFLSQDKYVRDIIKNFGYSDVRSANTPIDKENPWGKDGTGKDVDLYLYRSMIGSLMYLTASRPDIMFAVCACARHQVTPKECHLHAVKRIFRYLKFIPN
nr:hypothetical protein [Tanacetum cinerariifolium]